MRDEILRKIRKLRANEESARTIGSESEAEAFAGKIQDLLLRHKLSMADVPLDQAVREAVEEEEVAFADVEGVGSSRRRQAWLEDLADVLADAHGCGLLVRGGTNTITFVGKEANRATATYLLRVLAAVAARLGEEAYRRVYYRARKNGRPHEARGYKKAFLAGFVESIRQRLKRNNQDRWGGNPQPGSETGTALMLIETDAREAQDWIRQRYQGHASSIGGDQDLNARGYADGERAGASARMNVGIGSDSACRALSPPSATARAG